MIGPAFKPDYFTLKQFTMKSYQQVLSVLFTGALLLLSIALGAQARHGQHHQPRFMQDLEQLKTELQLTDEQQAQLEALNTTFEKERAELKNQQFDSPEAQHAAFKQLMQDHKARIDEVLTTEQKARLQQLKQERKAPRQGRMDKADKAALKSELKAYRSENILPVMKAQRAKLEEKLSPEDKAQITTLRASLKTRRQEMRALKQEANKSREDFQKLRETYKPDQEAIKALVEKYDADIDALLAEMQPQQEQWHKDIRAIYQKYRPEPKSGDEKPGPKGKYGHHAGPKGQHPALPGKPEMHKGRFLLLDPNAADNSSTENSALSKVSVFPNPAANEMTLQYTLEKAGSVRIELRNKEGNLVKVVKESNEKAGTQSVTIDASSLQEGIYYLTVISQGQQLAQKVVVARQ